VGITVKSSARRSRGLRHKSFGLNREGTGSMNKPRTHYDNLKVARNAPKEVIVAAYRSLSKMYHPDTNKSEDAARIFKIINAAYEVLTDDEKREKHNKWIQEYEDDRSEKNNGHIAQDNTREHTIRITDTGVDKRFIRGLIVFFAAIFVVLTVFVFYKPSTPKRTYIGSANKYSVPEQKSTYEPPPTVPEWKTHTDKGWPLPSRTGYVSGYSVKFNSGRSKIIVDNSGNNHDVFVKVFRIGSDTRLVARAFFIKSHEKFTARNVVGGKYDVRYRNLDTGDLAKSTSFRLEETQSEDGVQFNNVTMTLYTVYNGNMSTTPISESEFL